MKPINQQKYTLNNPALKNEGHDFLWKSGNS